MRWRLGIPLVLFAGGVTLITEAVLHGQVVATWAIVVLVLSGSSLAFAAGCALILAGFLSLPFLWAGAFREPEVAEPSEPEPTGSSSEAAAVVIIGPLPVFVGAWRKATTEMRWVAMVAGSVLALLFVLLVLWY